ncbi:MAG: HAMP domain-containing protein [Nitrospirae bacterium]|nr:HAMP domain-containing protein [Nitrospirota bacterium]
MRNIFLHPKRSIAAKLIIATGLLIVILSFIFWFAIFLKQQKDVMSIAVEYGNSFTDFIKRSTRYSMLTLHKDAIQETLEDINTAQGVERVRIFGHSGNISYSSNKNDVGASVSRDSITCTGCHLDTAKPSMLLPKPKKWDFYKSTEGVTTLKLVDTINNELSCYTAACHVHPQEQKILGFIEADISLALLDEALFKQGLALTAYILIFVLAISLFLGIINYKIVTHPVNELSKGMEHVATGDLDYSAQINSIDEIGMLASTFNAMLKDLKAAKDQRISWTKTLEAEIAKKTEAIQRAQAGLMQTEKLASLGRMSAGVAHEIAVPLTEVITQARLMKGRFPDDTSEAKELDVMIGQAEKCSEIIKNLQTFARATAPGKEAIDVNRIVQQTLLMVRNGEKFQHIKFNTSFAEGELITQGVTSQLQQICLNMLMNASDAMSEKGEIIVATRKVTESGNPYAEIEFTDTGTGIKDEDMPKLFEPFFTTKSDEHGTGLGLSVSHGIVKHLGGHINVSSTPGKGTSFFVRLPYFEKA